MRDYDSTVARIAGNIFSGVAQLAFDAAKEDEYARWCVDVARRIVAETKATEPAKPLNPSPDVFGQQR